MAWLIMDDKVDYASEFYPTHIVGFNNEVLPVYMGASSTLEKDAIGIYVSDEGYKRIDHTKEYVFIHNPDISDIESKFRFIEKDSELGKKIEELNISTVKDKLSMNRLHYQIWPTPNRYYNKYRRH